MSPERRARKRGDVGETAKAYLAGMAQSGPNSVAEPPAGYAVAPGRLRAGTWERFLRGPDKMLLDDLYVPALSEALRYDRCCAYFSSSVLAAAARGFGPFIQRLISLGKTAPRPAVRLVVNEEMAREDVKAMIETGDTSRLEWVLKRRFRDPKGVLERQRLAMLGWLVQEGLLDVRVGVMRHGGGVVHAKFGIVTDERGDAVVFCGSSNESAQGVVGNYEQVEVSTSWDDPARYRHYAEGEFTALWLNKHPDVHTVTLPEALRLKLIKYAPKEPPVAEPSNALARQKAAMVWRFIVEAPYFPEGGPVCDATAMVDLWPHQQRVVEETAEAWPEGRLLCDEVGMGKTIEAICVLRRLMAGRGVRRVLILLPAGLLKQWQDELREKGGMVFPRLRGLNTLVWPDEREERLPDLAAALRADVLLMSRETARTENNLPILLAAEPWDLAVLDESHAARRARQVEGEFNSGTLLLDLLRQLQLRRRARGFLLLSATPMQTHPWEPWDLLQVLGVGGAWLADFDGVRRFYAAVAATRNGCNLATARPAAEMILADPQFPSPPGEAAMPSGADAVARKIAFAPVTGRDSIAQWLRRGSPLARRMHRNTRQTLRRYCELGLLTDRPPVRVVDDRVFDFDSPAERRVYDDIAGYIKNRYEELESEKPGKGFVMTVYRRRAASSFWALERSLTRRREQLKRVAERLAWDREMPREDGPEALSEDDLPDERPEGRPSTGISEDAQTAKMEMAEVDGLLEQLQNLRGLDTKRDRFFDVLRQITDDGRPVLVFTEYADTMEYLRDYLRDRYGKGLGCFSGDGGRRWTGEEWQSVTKDGITRALREGELRALICTDAASEGLNLQAAGALINFDLPWSPSRVEQRIGRIDRIGQRYPEVKIVNLYLKDSVDDQVYRALRERCGLFEHFVGPMQPVLAQARRMLMGQEKLDLAALASTAAQVQQDAVTVEAYVENPAEAGATPDAAVGRAALEEALLRLDGGFGPKARRGKGRDPIELSGPGLGRMTLSATVEGLERDRTVIPLSPLQSEVRALAEQLSHTGEHLPLVVSSVQRGAFRCSVAFWVGDDGTRRPVQTLKDLQERVETWDGVYPDPMAWRAAEEAAQAEAEKRVRQMEKRAAQREREALQRQVEAARLRLLRELGRYLVCLGEGTADLNGTLHRQMNRDIASAERLRRALGKDRLDGYPEWPPALCEELDSFAAALPESQRRARLMGKELDAALDDPRWSALAR